jgi:hypothetical protein
VFYRWESRFALHEDTVVHAAAVAALCYSIACAETFFMANDFMSEQFRYLDRERMPKYGPI